MKPLTLTEPSSEALGSRTTLIAIAPSSRFGMNSVPILVAANPAATRTATESASVAQRACGRRRAATR